MGWKYFTDDYFCKTCGIFTYIGDGCGDKDGYRVNLGCVEGLDLSTLDISVIDGRSLPLIPGLLDIRDQP
jgi:hypothetical protein